MSDPVISSLKDWFNDQQMHYESERGDYIRLLQEPDSSSDPDVAYLGGRLEGKAMILESLSSFIVSTSKALSHKDN